MGKFYLVAILASLMLMATKVKAIHTGCNGLFFICDFIFFA